MAEFIITGPDGAKYRVSGDTEEGALSALKKHLGARPKADPQNSDGTYGQPPPGRVMNPKTGQMVDAAAIAQQRLQNPAAKMATAGAQFASGYPIIGGLVDDIGKPFGSVNEEVGRQALSQFQQQNPKTTMGLNIGGAVAGMIPAIATAPGAMGAGPGSLASNSLKSLISGGAIGGTDAAVRSNGDPVQTAIGLGAGAVTGGAAPAIGKAIGAAVNTVGGMLGIGNKARALKAIADALLRSGRSADDIADDLAKASLSGQPEYMAADAMGTPGQRMLSGVYRTPGDMRTTIADTLHKRQAGQGDRLVNALSDAFDAPDTAAQRSAALTAARKATADTNYAAARQGAGAVDISGTIQQIDDIVKPGVQQIVNPNDQIAGDSIEGALNGIRRRLTDGKSTLTDFDRVLTLKQDVGDMIESATRAGQGNKARILSQINNQLDTALEGASPGYRAANDTFKTQSRVIGAVDDGARAASSRTRAGDTVPAFQNMTPDQQGAFRAGYADPYIARVEAASSSPTTNKARILQTGKTSQEFPAFASPGKAPQLADRITREQRMFETANATMGGSRTADNLADTAEMAAIDPSIIGSLLRGRIGEAAVQSLTKAANTAQGRNSTTRDLIAKALLESNPDAARFVLKGALAKNQSSTVTQQALIRALLQGPASYAASGGGGF